MVVGTDLAWECMAAWDLWVDQWDLWEVATRVGVDQVDTKAMVTDHKEVIKAGVHRVSGEVTADLQAITAMDLKEDPKVVEDHMEVIIGTDGDRVHKAVPDRMEETCMVVGLMLQMVGVRLGYQLLLVQQEHQE